MNTPKTPQFLFLFRQPPANPNLSPEEMQKIFGEWMIWMKSLKDQGILLGGDQLNDSGTVIRGSRGKKVTDRPFAEAKEIVGGYIVVAADDLRHATKIAAGCPGLEHNGSVEVRPLELRDRPA